MPKVHPVAEESYLCTPIEIKDEEYFITGKMRYEIDYRKQRLYKLIDEFNSI